MDPDSSRFARLGRRARAAALALAVGGLAVAFAACGDDEQDEINKQIDEAQEQVGSALEDVDTEKLQSQLDEAQEQAESALDEIDTEQLKKQAEEAQKQIEEAGK